MIVVDDRLSIDAAAGRLARLHPELGAVGVVATTWGFHYRLVRALHGRQMIGSLTSAASGTAVDRLLYPAPSRLVVLDPRELTIASAKVAERHGANLLLAELVAGAQAADGRIALSERNVGRRWPEILLAEGIELVVVR